MTATQLVEKSLQYLGYFSPYLIVMFAIAFAYKLIDFVFTAIQGYRNRRW